MPIAPLFALTLSLVAGTTYHVAPTGNDAHSGRTAALALRTISRAAKLMKAGDTCLVGPGVYRETVRPPTDRITFRAVNANAVLAGGDLVKGFIPLTQGVFRALSLLRFTDLRQSDQILEGDRMLELARWPKNTGSLDLPTDAVVVEATDAGTDRISMTVRPAFNEPDGRWAGARVWVNLSHAGVDGQAQTGTVVSTDRATGTIVIAGIDKRSWSNGKYEPRQAWGIGEGTEVHLFDPTPEGVAKTGGAPALLAVGEWWIDGQQSALFVRPRSGKPVGIAQKQRSFAFDLSNRKGIVVDGFRLLGTTITTDHGADGRSTSIAASEGITLRNLRGRYLTHFTNHTGQYQMMWLQRSGIRLSGTGHLLERCVLEDVAGPAVSVIGRRNRVLGNTIRRANYSVSEAGALDTGRTYDPAATLSVDHEIAFNTIEDSPQQGMNIRGLINSNPLTPGLARVHHNIVRRVMMRSFDSAAIDQFGTDGQGVRIDHNLISDLVGNLRIGIYTDFGYGYLIDHNLVWNVSTPIQMNHSDEKLAGRVRVEWNTLLSVPGAEEPGIANYWSWNPQSTVLNNIVSLRWVIGKGARVEGNLVAKNDLFMNASKRDFRPVRELNAGALRFGEPLWGAGAAAYRPGH